LKKSVMLYTTRDIDSENNVVEARLMSGCFDDPQSPSPWYAAVALLAPTRPIHKVGYT